MIAGLVILALLHARGARHRPRTRAPGQGAAGPARRVTAARYTARHAAPLPDRVYAEPAGAAGERSPAAARPPRRCRGGAARPGTAACASGNGYLRARIRGAVNLDVDWHNGEIECAGGPRADGSGLRVSFAGPRHADGRRLRLVFGMGTAREGRAGRELPTNLTVIFEGEQRLFTTRGENNCTVDELRQERVGAPAQRAAPWRVVARGFCIAPASTLSSDARILVSRFDFAGTVVFGEPAPPSP